MSPATLLLLLLRSVIDFFDTAPLLLEQCVDSFDTAPCLLAPLLLVLCIDLFDTAPPPLGLYAGLFDTVLLPPNQCDHSPNLTPILWIPLTVWSTLLSCSCSCGRPYVHPPTPYGHLFNMCETISPCGNHTCGPELSPLPCM
ncbi:uncharacterized protein UHOD_12038 [Ustilago sp. UG-2017b]|nr:uncharacterized protein UHOD_12038 [Ustilago sp. UG-2017b]